jgi:hypothetical protein
VSSYSGDIDVLAGSDNGDDWIFERVANPQIYDTGWIQRVTLIGLPANTSVITPSSVFGGDDAFWLVSPSSYEYGEARGPPDNNVIVDDYVYGQWDGSADLADDYQDVSFADFQLEEAIATPDEIISGYDGSQEDLTLPFDYDFAAFISDDVAEDVIAGQYDASDDFSLFTDDFNYSGADGQIEDAPPEDESPLGNTYDAADEAAYVDVFDYSASDFQFEDFVEPEPPAVVVGGGSWRSKRLYVRINGKLYSGSKERLEALLDDFAKSDAGKKKRARIQPVTLKPDFVKKGTDLRQKAPEFVMTNSLEKLAKSAIDAKNTANILREHYALAIAREKAKINKQVLTLLLML